MRIWQINPEKKEIREIDVDEGHPALQGVEEWVWVRRGILGQAKRVIPVLMTGDPHLFSIPLDVAFMQMLARSLMSPPSMGRFSFLHFAIGLTAGLGLMFLFRR